MHVVMPLLHRAPPHTLRNMHVHLLSFMGCSHTNLWVKCPNNLVNCRLLSWPLDITIFIYTVHSHCPFSRISVKPWVVGCWCGYLWSEVQTCIWPSRYHCHSLFLASVKSRLVLPFWYQLTWVVPDKGPLNVCACVWQVWQMLFVLDRFPWLGRLPRTELW